MQLTKLTNFPKFNQGHILLSHFSRRVISLPVTQVRLTQALAGIPDSFSKIFLKVSTACPLCLPDLISNLLLFGLQSREEVDDRAALAYGMGSRSLFLPPCSAQGQCCPEVSLCWSLSTNGASGGRCVPWPGTRSDSWKGPDRCWAEEWEQVLLTVRKKLVWESPRQREITEIRDRKKKNLLVNSLAQDKLIPGAYA